MFEMSHLQQQAFEAATGTSARTYCHFFLFVIGALATIWLLLVFMGTIKSTRKETFESLYEFAWAIGIYIAIGGVVYFT
jgi:cytochrome c biogenesis protein CcdA